MAIKTFLALALPLTLAAAAAVLDTQHPLIHDSTLPFPPKHYARKVVEQLTISETIPTVLPPTFRPTFLVSLNWTHLDDAWHSTSLGNTIGPELLLQKPGGFMTPIADDFPKTHNLVLALTDPDAPSRDDPKWSQVCHWLVHIYQSGRNELLDDDAEDAEGAGASVEIKTLMSYYPPSPPPKTGKHRYVIVAYVPRNETRDVLEGLSGLEDRHRWGTGDVRSGPAEWAEDRGLMPVAANFIYSQNELQ